MTTINWYDIKLDAIIIWIEDIEIIPYGRTDWSEKFIPLVEHIFVSDKRGMLWDITHRVPDHEKRTLEANYDG